MTMSCSWTIPLYILQQFYLIREEVEKMTGKDARVHLHLFQGGIIVRRDDQVDAILEILVDDLNRPSLPFKYRIESVCTPLFGAHAYASSRFHLPTSNNYRFRR